MVQLRAHLDALKKARETKVIELREKLLRGAPQPA